MPNWNDLFTDGGKHLFFSWKCVYMVTFPSETFCSALRTLFLKPSGIFSIQRVENLVAVSFKLLRYMDRGL